MAVLQLVQFQTKWLLVYSLVVTLPTPSAIVIVSSQPASQPSKYAMNVSAFHWNRVSVAGGQHVVSWVPIPNPCHRQLNECSTIWCLFDFEYRSYNCRKRTKPNANHIIEGWSNRHYYIYIFLYIYINAHWAVTNAHLKSVSLHATSSYTKKKQLKHQVV